MHRFRITRRTTLRGIGTGLALPLLDIMEPVAAASAELTAPPVRSAFIFFPNGVIVDDWQPQGEGRAFRLGPTMEPLQEFSQDILILSGLAQHHARANGDGPGDHARNTSAFLTGAQPRKTSGADLFVGTSIDQAIAARIGDCTRLSSMELGLEDGRQAGNCDSGYSCAYSSNISWKGPSTPAAKEVHPRLAFNRLFGIRENSKEQKRRDAARKSVLDFVAADAQQLRRRAGGSDRARLDEYFQSVREVEQQIERAARFVPPDVPDTELPENIPGEFQTHVRLMYEIMALAFRTDSTRVCSFMLGNGGSDRTYPDVDVKDGHHSLSHHRDQEDKIAALRRIDRYLVEQFAWFLKRLKSMPEKDSTVLDHSMILYGSAISDGNRHRHENLPILLAGRGGGTIDTGRHVRYQEETPLNNLFLAMSQRMGADLESLGDSTGVLSLTE